MHGLRLGVLLAGMAWAQSVSASVMPLEWTGALDRWELSPHYAHVKGFMEGLVAQYPETTQLFDLGVNDAGVMIQGLRIGSGSVSALVVAAHHGNEYGSVEVGKAMAAALAASPIPDLQVFVIPVLNTTGFDSRSRFERSKGRSNDPNRDYPCPCGSDGPWLLKSTRALADFVVRENIVTSATLHTYSPLVGYPYGFSTRDRETEFDAEFERLGALATQESHYQVGNSGAILYPADGTFEDYAFTEHGIWSLLFELGHSHRPSYDSIVEMIRVNVPGITRFLEEAPRSRAARHAFQGQCDVMLKTLDRREE